MPKTLQTSGTKRFIDGYTDDVRLAGENHLCPPSVNIDILKTGEAVYRKGILPVSFDLGQALKASRPFHVARHNVTFFACNGKILFVNHNNSDAVVDTGISLTETDGRKTRFGEYAGDIYFTNRTDGLWQIHMGRFNGAASSAAAIVTLDQDFTARLYAFSDTSGTLRIANTSPFTEAFSFSRTGSITGAANNGSGLIRITSASHNLQTGVTVTIASVGGTTEANGTWVITRVDANNFDLQSSTFTNAYTAGGTWTWVPNGVLPLTGTLNADVADNTIVYTCIDRSSGRPKGSGLTFWKERMIIWGVINDTAVDSPTNLVYMSSFALISGGDGTALANIIDFVTTNTAAKEMLGKGGIVTNVLATRDYLYMFTQDSTYYASVSDVNLTTGGTLPQLLSDQYGCVNEDCAADMGNGRCVFLSPRKRFIGISISTETGAPVVFPDELFDSPVSNTTQTLDADQSDAFIFHAPNERRCYMHCNSDSNRIVLKFNSEIQKWEPPNTGWSFGGMYVKDGVTYATELTDDAVYQLNEGYEDNGIEYEKVAAIALVEGEDGRQTLNLQSVGISGRASELATITVENYVGNGSAQQKSFSTPSGVSSGSLGSVTLGTTTLGTGLGMDLIDYDKLFAIYPKYGPSYQLVVRSIGPFTLSSYSVYGSVMGRSLLTLQ